MDKGEKTGLKGRGKVCSARVTLVRTIRYTICVAHDSRVFEEVPVGTRNASLYGTSIFVVESLVPSELEHRDLHALGEGVTAAREPLAPACRPAAAAGSAAMLPSLC
jgi:hypothetical protein